MSEYRTTSGLGGFIEAVGWIGMIGTVIAVMVAIAEMPRGMQLLIYGIGAAALFVSLITIVNGQILRAAVAIANSTAQTAQEMTVLRKALAGDEAAPSGLAAGDPKSEGSSGSSGTSTRTPEIGEIVMNPSMAARMKESLSARYGVDPAYEGAIMRHWLGALITDKADPPPSEALVLLDTNGDRHGFTPAKIVRELVDKDADRSVSDRA